MAVAAAELLEPRWWAGVVVIMPIEQDLASETIGFNPIAYVYSITTGEAENAGARIGVRRWLRRGALCGPGAAAPRAQWESHLPVSEIAAVLDRPIPVWLNDTTTVENAETFLTYTQTFITETDTLTAWPEIQAQLDHAVAAGMPGRFPAGFAALAADAEEALHTVRVAHERTPDTGSGWYLACRPPRPAPPLVLEQRITGVKPVTDLDLVARELAELQALERDLPAADAAGDAYRTATLELARQLRDARGKPGAAASVPAGEDLAVYFGPFTGPVVDTWRKNLTLVDLDQARDLRRVQRLIDGGYENMARAAYRDTDGRYIIEIELSTGQRWFRGEWPIALDVVATWTDKTMLVGDGTGSVTTLLALTPNDDGGFRVDPVPVLNRWGTQAFAFGYTGGTPSSTYVALVRCVFGEDPANTEIFSHARQHRDSEDNLVSQLWQAISTTTGSIRLSWPQLQLWARADHKAASNHQM